MPDSRRGTGGESSRVEPPYVLVAGDPTSALVREVLAGIEEEGVPSRVVAPRGRCVDAARSAALAAPLEVGISVVDDSICLTHAKFPAECVVESVSTAAPTQARRLGHDAARIVLSVPLAL